MSAGVYDLKIEKGGTYRKNITLKNSNKEIVDLTGYTARMQIRKTQYSNNYLLNLTTESGGLTITGTEGKIEIYISDTDTSALTESAGIYDLELVSGTDVIKLLRGSVTIIEEITK